jgi:hypothetical protein
MRKIVSQKISIAMLLYALLCAVAFESFAQSSNPVQKQVQAVNDEPFIKMDHSTAQYCNGPQNVDYFTVELMNNGASATGYIYIYGQKDEALKNHVLLWQIKKQIKRWSIDASRIKIMTGELRAVGSTEFWIVPAGKPPPPIVPAEWDYKLSPKPQQINSYCGGWDEDHDAEFLIEFLKYNPDFIGEVRIEETSVKRYSKIAKDAVAYLVKTGAPRKRLKTVRLNSPQGADPYTIWLVPVSRSIGQMEIVYQFSNGPVSPEYQRDFTVTLNKTNAKLRFRSYGIKQPTEITVKTGTAKFKEIMELAGKIEIRKGRTTRNDGCVGGGGESLKVLDAKRTVTFSAEFSPCGSTDYGNLTGDLKLIKTKITALFPNEEYLK